MSDDMKNAPVIDTEEEIDFILEECEKKGISISRETLEFIFDLDFEFLKQKGVITYYK